MATENAQEARELYEHKHKAIQYYSENGVPQKMEQILNSTYFDNPNDVYGHLANFFEKFSYVPTVTKLKAREGCDSRGQATVSTELYCMIKNFEKLVTTTTCNSGASSKDAHLLKPDEREAVEAEKQKNLAAIGDFIDNSINKALTGIDPTMQCDADSDILRIFEKIMKKNNEEKLAQQKEEDAAEIAHDDNLAAGGKARRPSASPTQKSNTVKSAKGKGGKGGKEVIIIPDEPKEELICGCSAVSVVSQAVCQAGAHVKSIPLYQHIATLRFDELPNKFRIPLPMTTILCSGKSMPGKLNCVKEYMVVPKPEMPFSEAYGHIRKIYQHCANSLSVKGGVLSRNVNEIGALCPTYDKPETGLDLLQEAITSCGLTPGTDFHIALNCAGHEYFDYDKGKYEMFTGGLKTGEELADFWGDIVNRYHSIIALIDPIRCVEKEAWMKLCERLSEKCYIIGDTALPRPGLLKSTKLDPFLKTSGVIFKVESMNTVSDILSSAKKMEDAGNQIVISTSGGDSVDTFLVDLAIGMKARFLKLGAPNRGERVIKYNYMVQVESALQERGELEQWETHNFPVLRPPSPPVLDEHAEIQEEDATKDQQQ